MKRIRRPMPSVLLILVISITARAQEPPGNLLPGTAITSSQPSVIDGLTEVVAGENVLYVDTTGRYLVIGSIYDLAEDRDLSAERRAELKRARQGESVSLDQLPIDAGLTTGSGPKSLTVIMDPACGWCRRLWAESLRDLEGVTVHHLLPQASVQVIGILCASNPPEALARALEVAAITRKTPVPSAACRRQATQQIGRVAGFIEHADLHGTPVLIREDGAVHRGYLSRHALRAWLDGGDDHAR
jgi:thiol:disulfide interchange protein DsbC